MSDDEPRFEIRNRRSAGPTAEASETPVEAEAPVEPVEESEASEDGPKPPTELRPPGVGLTVWVLGALAVLSLVVAVLFWRSAANDPDRTRAELRDAAVIEGTAAVETMNSMDHRDVAAGVKAWQDVSTGVLHDQLVAMEPDDEQLLADQKKVAQGRVVQAALTELTERTATLIVAVEVSVSGDDDAEPTVKRNRFAADLVLVGGRWKLENLQQVAVGL